MWLIFGRLIVEIVCLRFLLLRLKLFSCRCGLSLVGSSGFSCVDRWLRMWKLCIILFVVCCSCVMLLLLLFCGV